MRVVVVGLGVQGKKRQAVAAEECVATIDPVNSAAQFRSLDDVSPSSYDAALVCAPDDQKLTLLRRLLTLGKHVLVEKPLVSPHSADLRELGQLARERGLALYTAYNHRFEPVIVRLKKTIDSGELGSLYLAKFFYGNGTARDVRNSVWRDSAAGVLGDLGCHLLDLSHFLFGKQAAGFSKQALYRFENRAYDHVLFSTENSEPRLQMEATLLSWKNTFSIDIFAEKGTAHVSGLCKWGPSVLTVRTRVLPSGRPTEEIYKVESKDPTWAAEYEHFKALVRSGGDGIENDVWIQESLRLVAEEK